jgi:transcriptional regulator with XRE-family HTH domain
MAAASRKPDPVDAFVGARIALRRMAMGLSQTALAQRLGVSFQQLQKYETGGNRISASRLHRLAVVLATTPAAFFPPGETDETSGDPADSWVTGLVFLTGTSEGRTVATNFPLIADRETRRSVARIVEALAAA